MLIFELALISIVLAIVTWKFAKFDLLLRLIIAGQTLYILFGLVFRPLVLLIVHPTPSYGDSLADIRLFGASGSYSTSLTNILRISLLGVISYFIVLYLLLNRKTQPVSYKRAVEDYKANYSIAFLSILFLAALSQYLVHQGSNFRPLIWVSDLGLPALGAIVFAQTNEKNRSKRLMYLSLVGAASIYFSLITKAKAPVFFAILIFFFYIISTSVKGHKSVRFIGFSLASIPVIFLIFNKLQAYKQSTYVNSVESAVSKKYFESIGNVYELLKRMDWLRALSDAYTAGPHAWYTFPQYLYNAATSILWNYGTSTPVFGQEWGINLLGSNSGSQATALSVNYVAEGWVLSGYVGVVFVAILMAFLTYLVLRLGQLGIYGMFFCLTIIASNTLFENGATQLIETISQATKETLIFAMLFLPFQTLSPSRQRSLQTKKL